MNHKQLEQWILKSASGWRFFNWFVRKNWERLLSSEIGYRFHEWMHDQVEQETKDDGTRRRVVIEINPDGFVRVFGENLDVVFVHRLEVHSREAEVLEEELATVMCPERAKKIYAGKCVATSFFTRRSIADEAERQSRMRILAAFRKPTASARAVAKS